MSIKSFFKLVEIQTKVASMIPFFLGTAYVLYRFKTFNLCNFLLMLASLIFIDMATTTINNLLDYKRANKKEGYGFEKHNAIVKYNMKETTVLGIIFVLVAIAVIFGVLLYLNTDIIVLILGALSFLVGVIYSFGPLPISRTPFGEIFSGVFMGLVIPFLAIYIHIFNQNIIGFSLQGGTFDINVKIFELMYIFLLAVPAAVGIANIMLANNICDMDEDLENKRYTLPILMGKQNALLVFAGLYFIGYASIIVLIALGVAPLLSLVTLATFPVVFKHIKIFIKKQSKHETFALSVKNLVLMNAVFVVTLVLAAIFKL